MSRIDDAQRLLDNPVFKEVLDKLYKEIEAKEVSVDPVDKDVCQKLIITRQQLGILEANIHAIIASENHKIELMRRSQELEEKNRNPKFIR